MGKKAKQQHHGESTQGPKKQEMVNIGGRVPRTVFDKFDQFCIENGLNKQDQIAGALFNWSRTLPNTREKAVRQALGHEPVDELFYQKVALAYEQALLQRFAAQLPLPDKDRG